VTSQAPARILIADDEPLFRMTTSQLLRKAGYDCVEVPDGVAALERLHRERFDLILSDLNMPGNFKLELLHEGRNRWPTTPMIVITGVPSLPTAIESVRLGIADYLLKPVKYDDLLSSVRRVLAHARRDASDERPPGSHDKVPDVLGASPPMLELFEVIQRVAITDANILITGESGTGKEVVAQAIHRLSARAQGPFQVVDCTAVPESLFESILFGHAKGAFTSAIKEQVGLLKQADGGSAFFDEIGELPLPLQAKLLRVIQEQSFTPLGKTVQEQIDTRFICATNRSLELEVDAGRFRRDLYYRLAVIHIELPPLRQRGDDVVLLARHFLQRIRAANSPVVDFDDATLDLFRSYRWPGNIRELRNAVEHGLAVARGDKIVPDDLPLAVRRPPAETSRTTPEPLPVEQPQTMTREHALEVAEKDYLISLLRQNGGNIAGSARQAGLSRQGLHKLLKKHQIDVRELRG